MTGEPAAAGQRQPRRSMKARAVKPAQKVWRAQFQSCQKTYGPGRSGGGSTSAGPAPVYGTPGNVGPVVKGDVLVGRIEGLPELSVRIV